MCHGHPLRLLAMDTLRLPQMPFMQQHCQCGVVHPLATRHCRACPLLPRSADWSSRAKCYVAKHGFASTQNKWRLLWPCNKDIPRGLSNAISNGQVQCGSSQDNCHAMSTGQCPSTSMQNKTQVETHWVKAQPANANGQCPTQKARRSKFFSLFSPDNVCNENPIACSPMASSHAELHAHAQPQNHGIPLNISMPV